VKLPNTGRGGTSMGTSHGSWVSAVMAAAAAAVPALLWRGLGPRVAAPGNDDS
jgi:hypothetical protein